MDQTQTQLTLSLVKLFPLCRSLSLSLAVPLSICDLLAAKTEIGDRNTCVVCERQKEREKVYLSALVCVCYIIKTPLRTFEARV